MLLLQHLFLIVIARALCRAWDRTCGCICVFKSMCVGVLFFPFQEGSENFTRYLGLRRPWDDTIEATRLCREVIADNSANEGGAECERNTEDAAGAKQQPRPSAGQTGPRVIGRAVWLGFNGRCGGQRAWCIQNQEGWTHGFCGWLKLGVA